MYVMQSDFNGEHKALALEVIPTPKGIIFRQWYPQEESPNDVDFHPMTPNEALDYALLIIKAVRELKHQAPECANRCRAANQGQCAAQTHGRCAASGGNGRPCLTCRVEYCCGLCHCCPTVGPGTLMMGGRLTRVLARPGVHSTDCDGDWWCESTGKIIKRDTARQGRPPECPHCGTVI